MANQPIEIEGVRMPEGPCICYACCLGDEVLHSMVRGWGSEVPGASLIERHQADELVCSECGRDLS